MKASTKTLLVVPFLCYLAHAATAKAMEPAAETKSTRIGKAESPSGRFLATAALGEAEAIYLTLQEGKKVRLTVTDLQGFLWLPSAPDTLLYGTSGLYGQGGLWKWTPTKGNQPVVKVDRPTDEAFILDSIRTTNGHITISYRQGNPEKPVATYTPKHLRL